MSDRQIRPEHHVQADRLPKKLIAYARESLGATAGEAWLQAAPHRARTMADRCGLTLAPHPHPGGTRSLVWLAVDRDRRRVIVRVDRPGASHLDAVRALARAAVAPHVIAADVKTDTSVVDYVRGRAARPGSRQDTARVGATLARAVLVTPPAGVPDFEQWLTSFTSTAVRRCPRWRTRLFASADRVRHARTRSASPDVLNHGDLVPKNVIVTATDTATLIDPEPHLGPVECDVAGWIQRTAIAPGYRLETHLAALTPSLSLDRALTDALLCFCDLTYRAYRVSRETTP